MFRYPQTDTNGWVSSHADICRDLAYVVRVLISLLHHRVFYSSINRVNIHYHRIQGFSPPLQHAQKYTNIIIIQTRPPGAHGYELIFATKLP